MPKKNKKVPNPNGKKGGRLHRKKIKELNQDIKEKKLKPVKEHYLKNPSGKSRFADIVGINSAGDIEEIHQVGKQNKNGTPVKRERDAMKDIEKISGIKVFFHPYNLLILLIFVIVAVVVMSMAF